MDLENDRFKTWSQKEIWLNQVDIQTEYLQVILQYIYE